MAKAIDEDKMRRIQEAAMGLIVENGYGGASISAIAKKAKVAEGYLYRFYKGKYELVNDMLNVKVNDIIAQIEVLLEQNHSLGDIIALMTRSFFRLANENPNHIKFIYKLLSDYQFSLDEQQDEKIRNLCRIVLDQGYLSGEIDKTFREEEVFIIMVMYPIQYINTRFKILFSSHKFDESDIQRVQKLCRGALKHTVQEPETKN